MLPRPPALIVAVLLGVALYALTRGDGGPSAVTPAGTGTVVHIADGDTVTVRLGGRDERVRYIGIDTPEAHRPGTPVQCFARAASKANARLVNHRRVRLVVDRERRDRYGRLLAYVYRDADGLFVNAELVRRGFARAYAFAPNTRHARRFAMPEKEARHAGRGLWKACPGLAQRY
jgi:micrococcal nuclease